MSIAVQPEHRELEKVARLFLAKNDALGAARQALDGGPAIPAFWSDLAALDWLGLHVPEKLGGVGLGLMETAVVVGELGRQCAPGPYLSSMVVAHALASHELGVRAEQILRGIMNGSEIVGLAPRSNIEVHAGLLTGRADAVLFGAEATVLAIVVDDDLVLIDRDARGLEVQQREVLDAGSPCVPVVCTDVIVRTNDFVIGGAAPTAEALRVLSAAAAAGGAAACTEMAAAYASQREAFGRPIGAFQGVKHHCANMLIDAELAAASVWDAMSRVDGSIDHPDDDARNLVAVVMSVPAFTRCAQRNIQVHGGIGFTWEHDAHLYLRRALTLAAIVGSLDGHRRVLARADLRHRAPGAVMALDEDQLREQDLVRSFITEYWRLDARDRHHELVRSGYLFPHWPKPWGRAASPAAQLIIDAELSEIPRMDGLGPTGWTVPIVLPTIMAFGTPEQADRWILPTMRGDITWCQLFSEPEAGSDLASLRTRATRVDGGWILNGQKVWTSHAHLADLGFALVRTNPDAPKHQGITALVVDMRATGVEIRPLRQITGETEFNEVFLDDVFVADADVVGQVDQGWTVARTLLGNERLSVGMTDVIREIGDAWQAVEDRVRGSELDPHLLDDFGDLVSVDQSIQALNRRAVAKALGGIEPGVEGNLTKLLGAETGQRLADFAQRLLGPAAVYSDGEDARFTKAILACRSGTIAGGTSEIVRNVISERVLGLPRD